MKGQPLIKSMKIIYFFIAILFLFGCSSKEVTKEQSDYVFDVSEFESEEEDNKNNLTVIENQITEQSSVSHYLIQIGAFTTENRAKRFAEKSKKLLNEEIIVSFSDRVNLFVVQLEKKFNNKSEAEIVRDNLKLFPEFQDAWIISVSQ